MQQKKSPQYSMKLFKSHKRTPGPLFANRTKSVQVLDTPKEPIVKEKRKKYLLLLTKLGIIIALGTGMVRLTQISLKLFQVKEIICESEFGTCPSKVLETLNQLIGQPIYAITFDSVAKLDHQIKLKAITRKLPHTLIINITVPKAAVVIKTDQSKEYIVVSIDGEILGFSPNSNNLPVVEVNPSQFPTIGYSISDTSILSAIKLGQTLSLFGFSRPHVVVSDDVFVIKNISSSQIVASPASDPENVATTLQQVLAKARMSEKFPIKIDLRFSHPVLTF